LDAIFGQNSNMRESKPAPISVVLAVYDVAWPRLAEEYAKQLRVLDPNLIAVHHIGSTSVPGLAAKPVIDLLPVVKSLELLDQDCSLVEALGFQWHGELGISGRRYCNLTNLEGRRIAHLHFFEATSPHIARHLAFRDYLRLHPNVALEYAAEKRRARDLHPHNSHDYADAKSAWIKNMEAKALDWYFKR
jgi:GrpB-like predicted nucleotidyltransferase (UPF0157 family)